MLILKAELDLLYEYIKLPNPIRYVDFFKIIIKYFVWCLMV